MVALLVYAGDLRGQDDSPGVGTQVVTKYTTPLRVGTQVVDDDSTFRVYTVERVDGGQLWLVSGSVRGWVPAGDVIPLDQAIDFYTQEIRDDPANAAAYSLRGMIRQERGEWDLALADFSEVIRLDPEDAEAFINRGSAWEDKREYDRAIADYGEAIRLSPNLVEAFLNRGGARAAKHDYDKALADFNEAIRIDPKFADAFNGRAWLWATCLEAKYRDGQRAIASATRACEMTEWKDATILDTLAAAYAEAGNFEKAVEYQQKANALYTSEDDRRTGQERLTLYEGGKPYREDPDH